MAQQTLSNVITALFFIYNYHCVFTFNIDTKIPVIKNNTPGSYFGYSVIQHQIYSTTDNNRITDNLLIAGAPLQDVDVFSLSDYNEDTEQWKKKPVSVKGHGAVYRCPLSTLQDDCKRIPLGSMGYDGFVDTADESENVTGQWLGVVTARQRVDKKPNILVCAHRFKKHKDSVVRSNWGFGRCFALENDLTYLVTIEPCASRAVSRGHVDFGYCMSGTSGAVTDDGNYIMGAPGALTYRGVLFMYNNQFVSDSPTSNSPVSTNSYLGFSSTSGRYSGKNNKVLYVTGAPHGPEIMGNESRNNGQVVIFSAHPTSDKLVFEQLLLGTELSSMFGFSLCTEDVNGDGNDDLMVSAPFLFRRHELLGGAVYIYYGGSAGLAKKPQVLYSRKMEEKECEKLGCTHAQFGHAMTSLGDINRDGYNDVAISAPYEGRGAVYIYHGSENGLLPEPSQRIIPSELNVKQKLETFGSSLSGALDLDDNGYPDLAIGAYESDAVVLLRTRPIIKLYSNVTLRPSQINPLDKNKACPYDKTKGRQCIQLNLCLRFTTDPPKKFRSRVTVKYTIKGFKYPDAASSRIEFKDGKGDAVMKEVALKKQRGFKCFEEIAYLQKKISDKQRPLKFEFQFDLQEQKVPVIVPGSSLPEINDFPVLDSRSVTGTVDTQVFDVEFINDCNGKICSTDLKLGILVHLPEDEETGFPTMSIGVDSSIDLNVTLWNQKEAAYMTRFFLKLPNGLNYMNVISDENVPPVSCKPSKVNNVSYVICTDIGNPLASDVTRWFVVKLNPPDSDTSSGEIFKLDAWANSTSNELKESDNFYTTHVKVITRTDVVVGGTPSPEQVLYGGDIIGESAIQTVEDIGREVNHTYTVLNAGQGIVDYSTLYIYWPYELAGPYPNGKHVLYLLGVPKAKQPIAECFVSDPKVVDPAGILTRQTKARDVRGYENRRVAREVADEEPPAEITYSEDPDGDGVKTEEVFGRGRKKLKAHQLDCNDRSTVRCVDIRCEIQQLGPKDRVDIVVNSRMWKSTFLERFRNVDGVSIISRARIVIPKELKIVQDPQRDEAMTETTAIPDIKITEEDQKVKWWIILIAVIGGLLLLAVLIIIFWKLGFFKRKAYGAVATHEAKVEKQKEPLD